MATVSAEHDFHGAVSGGMPSWNIADTTLSSQFRQGYQMVRATSTIRNDVSLIYRLDIDTGRFRGALFPALDVTPATNFWLISYGRHESIASTRYLALTLAD